LIPRVGHEVVVQFLEGDPDRPLIVGCVASGDQPSSFTLPEHKSISTFRGSTPGGAGFGESTTVSNAKNTAALKRKRQQVTKNPSLTVPDGDQETVVCKGHSLLTVKQDRKVVVQSGSHQVEVCSGDSNHIVRRGHHNIEVDTGHSTLLVKTGNHTTEVQSGHHTVQVQAGNSGVWIKSGSHATSARKSLTLASVTADLSLSAATLCSASAGQALSLAAPEISVVATRRIMLGVGKSTIVVDETGVTISGPQISSPSVETQTITGP
jgi:type VI secretion system secreted protein VgrG